MEEFFINNQTSLFLSIIGAVLMALIMDNFGDGR